MKYKLLIFDFDGTLADTRAPIVMAKQETMRQMGIAVMDEETCASTIGLTARLGFQQLYPDLPEEKLEQCVALYRALFDELAAKNPPVLFPGVLPTLKELSRKGHILTIATSRHNASLNGFLEALDLKPLFHYVLGGEDTPLLKPNPDAVLKTLKDLDIPPEKALVIGDMPFDILMAKRAGVAACGVSYGNAAEEELYASGADYVISSFSSLLKL